MAIMSYAVVILRLIAAALLTTQLLPAGLQITNTAQASDGKSGDMISCKNKFVYELSRYCSAYPHSRKRKTFFAPTPQLGEAEYMIELLGPPSKPKKTEDSSNKLDDDGKRVENYRMGIKNGHESSIPFPGQELQQMPVTNNQPQIGSPNPYQAGILQNQGYWQQYPQNLGQYAPLTQYSGAQNLQRGPNTQQRQDFAQPQSFPQQQGSLLGQGYSQEGRFAQNQGSVQDPNIGQWYANGPFLGQGQSRGYGQGPDFMQAQSRGYGQGPDFGQAQVAQGLPQGTSSRQWEPLPQGQNQIKESLTFPQESEVVNESKHTRGRRVRRAYEPDVALMAKCCRRPPGCYANELAKLPRSYYSNICG